jgi:glycosyltransferase involved in cell wall biosynthesis
VRFPERSVVDAAGRRELKAALVRGLDAPARTALEPLLDSRWLLYMARLDSTKGQDRALALWERLSPLARSKSALLFVGPESEAGTLKKLRDAMKNVPDPSRVLFLGATHSPDLWLGCSDVALSCSQFEGMPLGPIEAAGAGLPLVLSEIPGHAALKDCGAQYLLGDPDQGARLLERTLAELESAADGRFREAWEKARDIRSRYTLSRMSDAYARLYHA